MVTSTLAHRWFVGIDLHKETLTVCIYCPCCGEIRFQKLVCRCRKQIAEFFGTLPELFFHVRPIFNRLEEHNWDAYFAAIAQSSGWTLVTFDRGFQRFPDIQVEFLR